jgi:acetyl esterase/lipase
MSAAWMLLAAGLAGLALAVNVVRPVYAPGAAAIVSFFAGWLVGELAPHVVVAQILCAAALVHFGALSAWPGIVGLAAACAACLVLAVSQVRATRARHAFDRALAAAFGDGLDLPPEDPASGWLAPALGVGSLALPFPVRHPQVTCRADLEFWSSDGAALRLDVHRRRAPRTTGAANPALSASAIPGQPRPTFIYVHGGAWMIGDRRRQGLPLLQHLAARGWACFSVDYRLSPAATFPDHVIDVKRAIAWVRDRAAEYGADPDFVVIAGNSAGGHLASLAALTAHDPVYQPGFESSDTSVQACVAFYGVYDFLDRNGHWRHPGMLGLLEKHVMKQRRDLAPAAFDAASPIARVHAGAPPFLVVHGSCDSVCPVAEARSFFAALQSTSRDVAAYAELPGAQHAFEIFPSVRTAHTLDGVTRFLAHVYSRHCRRGADVVPRHSGFRRSREPSSAGGL